MAASGGERDAPVAPPPHSEATITPYRDGPYLIRGPFRLLDQDGNEIALRRRTIALCRCGKSRMRPLCDGTHRTIGFRAPSQAETWPDTLDPEQSTCPGTRSGAFIGPAPAGEQGRPSGPPALTGGGRIDANGDGHRSMPGNGDGHLSMPGSGSGHSFMPGNGDGHRLMPDNGDGHRSMPHNGNGRLPLASHAKGEEHRPLPTNADGPEPLERDGVLDRVRNAQARVERALDQLVQARALLQDAVEALRP